MAEIDYGTSRWKGMDHADPEVMRTLDGHIAPHHSTKPETEELGDPDNPWFWGMGLTDHEEET